ncbi:DNA-directed RNA polymerase I subunit rpa49 [Umbelopsis sp. WA50703]
MTKRKHHDNEATHPEVKVVDSKHEHGGPVIVTFPGTEPAQDTLFDIYKNRTESKKKQRIVAGETEKIEFVGKNYGPDTADLACRYVVGVYSKKDNTVTLQEAPVFNMHRTVKALKGLKSQVTAKNSFLEAKNTLGDTFGTKKARQQIRSAERNEVKAEALGQDVVSTMQNEIDVAAQAVPTIEDIRKEQEQDRPVPPYDATATTPENIYDLEDIISSEELNAVPIKDILKCTTADELKEQLPYTLSKFVNSRLLTLVTAKGKTDRKQVRMLVYVSYLMAYYQMRPAMAGKRDQVNTTLYNPPAAIVDRMLERYTSSGRRTPMMQDKLACYMLILCLMIDKFIVDPELLASDLSLKPTKTINLLKNVGCKVEYLSATQVAALGLTGKVRRASLIAPVTFPVARKIPERK